MYASRYNNTMRKKKESPLRLFNLFIVISLIGINNCRSSSPEIIEEYTGQNRTTVLHQQKITDKPDINADYSVSQKSEIPLALEPSTPQISHGKKVLYFVGRGLRDLSLYTFRYTSGFMASVYFSQSVSLAVNQGVCFTAAYIGTENIILAQAIYLTGITLSLPISTAIVFYLGSRSPEIIYYSGKTVYKSIELFGTAISHILPKKVQKETIVTWYQDNNSQDQVVNFINENMPEMAIDSQGRK